MGNTAGETAGETANETAGDTAGDATGSCLCGAVRYRVGGTLRDVWQCHCRRCRKTTGNFMAATGAPLDAITITGEPLTWYRPADDPNVAYGFCARCGSSLFWRVVDQGDDAPFVSICAGTLDDAPDLQTTAIWFAHEAAPHTLLDPAALDPAHDPLPPGGPPPADR